MRSQQLAKTHEPKTDECWQFINNNLLVETRHVGDSKFN